MNCTLCESNLDTRADDYYFICGKCGAYLKDSKHYVTNAQERSHYEEHNNDVTDVRYQYFTTPITNAIFKNHSEEQLGLDFGCGNGPVISKQLIDKGFRVVLFDPYFHPDKGYLENQYDYIFSCEVFEHFFQPKQEIEKLLHILKPGGKLYIMTHLFDPGLSFAHWYYRKDPTHVFIYTENTIKFLSERYNLTIEILTDRFIILKKE